jgi:succinylarginine dihydrolase
MSQRAYEVNFDGLVGPTHNYAGLSIGNLASMAHGQTVSHPKEAALQGLQKMKMLYDMGLNQAVIPPQERPDFSTLRRLGFEGSETQILQDAQKKDPSLLAAFWSASSMWTANAATVSPGADTTDGKVHFTPANLMSLFHRSLEPEATFQFLKSIFPDESVFTHHLPLPKTLQFGDEGAANHARFCGSHAEPGVELFVFGRGEASSGESSRYPARQTREASSAVARLNRLGPERTVLARQNPEAIEAGVFHNDVIALGNENVLLFHGQAFEDESLVLGELKEKFSQVSESHLAFIRIESERLSLTEAVETYLFNSQLITLPEGGMCLVAPSDCEENQKTREILSEIVEDDNPISMVRYVEVRQSMKNGGGPACLRLRVVLTEEELEKVHPSVLLTEELYEKLTHWVGRHYRDRLAPYDLVDPELVQEGRNALDELTQILTLGPIYSFQ